MLPIAMDIPKDFLEEETREGYSISEKQKKIWAVELDLLNKLDRVCSKYHLKYFVDCGTLLGAVRHKGYIPWDDDIDVSMLRTDYEKLLKVAEKEFFSPYFLQYYKNDFGFSHLHAQLRNSFTTGMLSCEGKNVSFNQGIFLDIFPLDVVSKHKSFRAVKYYVMRIIYRIMPRFSPYRGSIFSNLFKKHGLVNIYSIYDKLAQKCLFPGNKVGKMTFYPTGTLERMEEKLFPIKYFEKQERLPFEHIMVPVSPYYDNILNVYYGPNYMVPINSGNAHGEVFFDPERPYTDYT